MFSAFHFARAAAAAALLLAGVSQSFADSDVTRTLRGFAPGLDQSGESLTAYDLDVAKAERALSRQAAKPPRHFAAAAFGARQMESTVECASAELGFAQDCDLASPLRAEGARIRKSASSKSTKVDTYKAKPATPRESSIKQGLAKTETAVLASPSAALPRKQERRGVRHAAVLRDQPTNSSSLIYVTMDSAKRKATDARASLPAIPASAAPNVSPVVGLE
jgi:hypothetical protein